MSHQRQLVDLISKDSMRMRALRALCELDLPQGLLAAGFVRNAVWDYLFDTHTKLQDIDVIYYCPLDCSPQRDLQIEQQLHILEPNLPWSVKNQARMHVRNGDSAYTSCRNAMAFWPEKETAVGVYLDNHSQVKLVSAFGLDTLFGAQLTHNQAKSMAVFSARIESKQWFATWPKLKIVYSDSP